MNFTDLIIPGTIAFCALFGFVIKTTFDFVPNKYIPAIMGSVGIIANIFLCGHINFDIVLGGLASGLASTGMYEMVRNFIERK